MNTSEYVPVSLESCKLGSLFVAEREITVTTTKYASSSIVALYDDTDTITLSVGDTFLIVETQIETKPIAKNPYVRVGGMTKDGVLFWTWWSSNDTPFRATHHHLDNDGFGLVTIVYATPIVTNTP